MSEAKAVEIATRAHAAIERIAGKKSPYQVRAEENLGLQPTAADGIMSRRG
jgi:hypothetical protein